MRNEVGDPSFEDLIALSQFLLLASCFLPNMKTQYFRSCRSRYKVNWPANGKVSQWERWRLDREDDRDEETVTVRHVGRSPFSRSSGILTKSNSYRSVALFKLIAIRLTWQTWKGIQAVTT